jgi:four helix bundle protein
MRPKSESSLSAAAAPAAAETVTVFAHTSLDAHRVALEALVRGDAIARKLPRGYGPLRDQLSRALQSAYLQTDEGAAKSGAERRVRLSSARAEAGEAAAALEAVVALGLGSRSEGQAVMVLLSRLCAMLTGLCKKAGG